MSSKDENDQENEKSKKENEKLNVNQKEKLKENENEDDDDDIIKIFIHSNEYDEETINQNKKKKNNTKIKWSFRWNIDKSKSFEDQIKSIRKVKSLGYYYYVNEFGEKELKFKIFQLRLAHLSNEIDEDLFEQIFDHTLIKLADKLINTTNKEENQIIINNINKNKDKLFKEDEFNDFLIQAQQRSDLKYTIDLILDFNEELN